MDACTHRAVVQSAADFHIVHCLLNVNSLAISTQQGTHPATQRFDQLQSGAAPQLVVVNNLGVPVLFSEPEVHRVH